MRIINHLHLEFAVGCWLAMIAFMAKLYPWQMSNEGTD